MPRLPSPSRVLPLLAALAAAGCSLHGGRFTVLEENDVFDIGDGLDTDRDYTQGGGGAFTLTDEDTPGWARAVPFVGGRGAPRHLAILVGQEIYTPEFLLTPVPEPDDRPYAGWLFAGAAIQSPVLDPDPIRRRDRVDTLRLDLGVVGPAARAKEAQDTFHDLFGIPRAEGWGRQIADRPGVLASWETRWRLGAGDLGGRTGWDLLPRARIRAGNVRTDATAGAEARFGVDLPRNFGQMEVDSTGLTRGAPPPPPWAALHAGIEGGAVARDIFLESPPAVEPVPFVFGSSAGISAGWGPLSAVFEQHYVSPRFKDRRRFHAFVTVSIAWAWYF